MKYPYIGKGTESGSIVLFYEQGQGVTLDSKSWASKDLEYHTCIDEDYFNDITREQVKNTKVKIESEGHEILVRGVASNADLLCVLINGTAFIFDRDIEDANKEIIIPLPPTQLPEVNSGAPMPEVKEPKKVSMNEVQVNVTNNTDSLVQIKKSDDESSVFIYVNDPPKESEPKEPEPKEWPQIGDKVAITGSDCKFNLISINNGRAWIERSYSDSSVVNTETHEPLEIFESHIVFIDELKKPLTPEEELTNELVNKLQADQGVKINNEKFCALKVISRAIVKGRIKNLSYKPE